MKIETGMSEYVKKGPNKYLNIFGKLKPHQTNMRVYSKDWNLHEWIFKYIWGQSLNEYSNIFKTKLKKLENIYLKYYILGKKGNKTKIFANIFWS